MDYYVVIMFPAPDLGTSPVKLVGPFTDSDSAATWGRNWQQTNNDIPCWQVVEYPHGAVPVITVTAP